MQAREEVEKSRFTVFFKWLVAAEGRKVGSLKWRVRSHLARWEMKNCTRLWHGAHFEAAVYKTPQLRSTFRSWDVEKVHAVVARSTFPSPHHSRTTFGSWHVGNVHAVVAWSAFRSQKCKKLTGLEHFWTCRCRFAWQVQGILHVVKSEEKTWGFCSSFNYNHHCTTLHSTTTTTKNTTTTIQLQQQLQQLHYATLHHTTLHCTTLITLHYTTPQLQLHYTYNYSCTTPH